MHLYRFSFSLHISTLSLVLASFLGGPRLECISSSLSLSYTISLTCRNCFMLNIYSLLLLLMLDTIPYKLLSIYFSARLNEGFIIHHLRRKTNNNNKNGASIKIDRALDRNILSDQISRHLELSRSSFFFSLFFIVEFSR